MKKLLTLLAALVFTSFMAANATCWRVNPSPFAKAKFKTVEEAMNDINVLAGDTLLLDPGKHGNVNVTPRNNITIIGAGYFLDKNKTWAESQSTIVGSVVLGTGSKIEGCNAALISQSNNSEKVSVSRCKIDSYISLNSNSNSNVIERCIVDGSVHGGMGTIIRNNIINGSISDQEGSIIENNIVYGYGRSGYGDILIYSVNNSTIRNNIFINTRPGFDSNQIPNACKIYANNCTNNVIQNNVLSVAERYIDSSDMFKGYPNNYYVGATIEDTFVNTGSDDAKWQLLETSAAKGAATHGGDCGAFGGPTPYVLSGIPMFLPHITEALVPAKPTDGKITVKLKIENQNE